MCAEVKPVGVGYADIGIFFKERNCLREKIGVDFVVSIKWENKVPACKIDPGVARIGGATVELFYKPNGPTWIPENHGLRDHAGFIQASVINDDDFPLLI